MELDRGALQRIRQSVERLERELARRDASRDPRASDSTQELDPADTVALLLAFAYPDRIGRAREGGGGRYLLSGGRGAVFAGPTALARSEYIVVAALDLGEREARIELAAPLDVRLLVAHFATAIEEHDIVSWDARSEAVIARRQAQLGALLLRDDPLAAPDERSARAALLEGIRTLGLGALPWRPELTQWRARVAFAREQEPDGAWPDVSEAALIASLETWLDPWLDGVTRRAQLARIDLRGALHALLDRRAQRRLDEFAPTHLVVPSGSRIPIDYGGASRHSRCVCRRCSVWRSRLDRRRPRAGHHGVAVTRAPSRPGDARPRELLGPRLRRGAPGAQGPYPRHYWPEDPHRAEATRRVRPR